MASPGTRRGRFVTRARTSCIKHLRGVKFYTGCRGQVGAGRANRGGGRLSHRVSKEERGGEQLRKVPDQHPGVTDEPEVPRG